MPPSARRTATPSGGRLTSGTPSVGRPPSIWPMMSTPCVSPSFVRKSQVVSKKSPSPLETPNRRDLAAELTKLRGLLDAGALTPDEFQTAKQRLLAGA
jgi:hypothetical protein